MRHPNRIREVGIAVLLTVNFSCREKHASTSDGNPCSHDGHRINCPRKIVSESFGLAPKNLPVRTDVRDSRGGRHDNGVSRRASNGRHDAHAVDRPR